MNNTTTQEDRILDAISNVIGIVERLDQEITDLQDELKALQEENKELENKIESLERSET